ncbi:hypothetical protein IQ266_05290 [filamentous cyanobacterium LEGE 11480]|uniref:Armadillo-type fold-containing protein n=1 Tax=Romeriopsis navalis LEGE 11480 TaxID=2777977 RepID=A0A928Z1C1_9CYAN|nr:hypothetical protein [Romeriopsis navalis]MBE9029176.1 hypothetical protein [Romeriopsis navalis LEGE 11480]
MAVQSSKSDFLTEFLQELLPADAKVLQLLPKPLRQSARWMTIGAGTALLLTWNGRLVVSTGAGLGTIWLAYSMRDWGWRAAITDFVNALEGVDRRITLSVLAGAGATFGTYTVMSIWLEAQSHWLATGMILQGTVTMGALGALLWQRLQPTPRQSGLMQHISNLTHADPLQRLIAVRQINHLLSQHPEQQPYISEFYQVLLTREPDRLVRDAVMDGLQAMSSKASMAPAKSQAFQARARYRATASAAMGSFTPATGRSTDQLLPITQNQSQATPKTMAVENFE